MAIARSMDSKDQTAAPGAPKKAPRQGRNPATMTKEEMVAYAMQMSMTEENKKGGGGPLEAHKEGDNMPSSQADRGEVLYKDPGAGVM